MYIFVHGYKKQKKYIYNSTLSRNFAKSPNTPLTHTHNKKEDKNTCGRGTHICQIEKEVGATTMAKPCSVQALAKPGNAKAKDQVPLMNREKD